MKYSLQCVTRNGVVYNDTIFINYANLKFHSLGNKFLRLEDCAMYNVHVLHADITADITYVRLSMFSRTLFERGNKTVNLKKGK